MSPGPGEGWGCFFYVGARHAGHPKNALHFLGTPDSPLSQMRRCCRGATHASPLAEPPPVDSMNLPFVRARHAGHPKKCLAFFGDPRLAPLSGAPMSPQGDACDTHTRFAECFVSTSRKRGRSSTKERRLTRVKVEVQLLSSAPCRTVRESHRGEFGSLDTASPQFPPATPIPCCQDLLGGSKRGA